MAQLTQLGEKLGEVMGLGRAACATLAAVGELEGADRHRELLQRLADEERELVERLERSLEGLGEAAEGVRAKAADVEREATDMRRAYLSDEDDALDGFEFLTMAEAGELGHWEIVRALSAETDDEALAEVVDHAVPLQERHFHAVRQAALVLAEDRDPDARA